MARQYPCTLQPYPPALYMGAPRMLLFTNKCVYHNSRFEHIMTTHPPARTCMYMYVHFFAARRVKLGKHRWPTPSRRVTPQRFQAWATRCTSARPQGPDAQLSRVAYQSSPPIRHARPRTEEMHMQTTGQDNPKIERTRSTDVSIV
jgi:hypothetical protein